MTVADLIPAPDLEIRDPEQLAAEAIGYTSGGLTVARLNSQIEILLRLIPMVESGTLAPPICPELTNANPSAPHTVLLEAMGWLLFQIAYRVNQLPKRDQIEFARLFKIELRSAAPASTLLEFAVGPPDGVDVTIPVGTKVATSDGKYIFETTAEVVIEFGGDTGLVPAQNTVAGATLLAPDVLTVMIDPIAWVDSVTNPDAIDGGNDDEAIEEALERARSYQRRGERLVSTQDFEDAILFDVLRGSGIVRGFPFVLNGAFGLRRVGHSTFIVMTANGNPVSADNKRAINAVLEQRVGNQFIYISDPIYIDFDVAVDVRLIQGAPIDGTKVAIEAALRRFYAPDRSNFGRKIARSEIITVIEGTPGVDRIETSPTGPILASPIADVTLDAWQLPRVVNVTPNVV